MLAAVLAEAMKHPFFRRNGPRTAGREEFGREYVREFLKRCGGADTARCAGDGHGADGALHRRGRAWARQDGPIPRLVCLRRRYAQPTLMAMIRSEVADLGIEVLPTDAAGVPSQAKEAIAFAVLAYQSWHRQASNVPGATGAGREVILGKVSYA